MTKKTNSLLFRLGVNCLWRLKIANFTKIFNTLNLEKFLSSQLNKFNWQVLSTKWKFNNVSIQVYSNFNISKNLKYNIFKYLKKVKRVKKISKKFSINSYFISNILKKMNFVAIHFKLNYYKILKQNIFLLCFKVWFLNLFIKSIQHLRHYNVLGVNSILQILFKNTIILAETRLISNYRKKSVKYELKKINGFLYFRILSLFIQNSLFNFTKKKININVNNIWHNEGWAFYFKNLLQERNKFLIQLLFLSCLYNNTEMFAKYIAINIQKTKNHKRLLRQITLAIETFWKKRKLTLLGIQLRVTGKLNGKMRKSKYHYNIGKVQLQTISTFLNYDIAISYTKFGIMSVKFWLLYENKEL